MKKFLKSVSAWVIWAVTLGSLICGHYFENDGLVSLGVVLVVVGVVISFLLTSMGMAGLVFSTFLDKGESLKDVELPSKLKVLLGVITSAVSVIVLAYLGHTVLGIFYMLSTVYGCVFLACLFGMAKKNE